jgi:hypothetical protein
MIAAAVVMQSRMACVATTRKSGCASYVYQILTMITITVSNVTMLLHDYLQIASHVTAWHGNVLSAHAITTVAGGMGHVS